MEYDPDRLDEIVLALLHLNSFAEHGITRAWKGFDWDSFERAGPLMEDRPVKPTTARTRQRSHPS